MTTQPQAGEFGGVFRHNHSRVAAVFAARCSHPGQAHPGHVDLATVQANVAKRLKALPSGLWSGIPDYEERSRDRAHLRLEQLHHTIGCESDGHDSGELSQAASASHSFVEDVFDAFEGKRARPDVSRVFLVTRRATRNDSTNEYESESIHHMPLLSGRFGVNAEIRTRAMYGWPPAILDTYTQGKNRRERGALMVAPLYGDMVTDLSGQQLISAVQRAIHESASMAHHGMGADVLGLGALLPKITRFGQYIRDLPGMEGLTTTTGHGGTVHLVVETVLKVLDETSTVSGGQIGVVGGAGSIGWSSIATVCARIPEFGIRAFDTNVARLSQQVADADFGHRITIGPDAIDVLRRTNVVIVAITGTIDLDVEDPNHALDLSGKVIIDDSQPGCFSRDQVEARGGKLVWVVGHDSSETKFATRDGIYTGGVAFNYGDSCGLYGNQSEFGCGLEAAVIGRSRRYDAAIQAPVTPGDTRLIAELFTASGLTAAGFQSFGRPVAI